MTQDQLELLNKLMRVCYVWCSDNGEFYAVYQHARHNHLKSMRHIPRALTQELINNDALVLHEDENYYVHPRYFDKE